MNKEKIGLGIITCNRLDFLKKNVSSLPEVDELVIVNDGEPYPEDIYPKRANVIQHSQNLGIAKSKNDALRYLFNQNCTHIFLSEDDMIIKNKNVLNYYISAYKASGIKHFNFGYVKENLKKNGSYWIKKIMDFNGNKIVFFRNISGSFSYFHKDTIKAVGYMDERYKNALEHVDHTYQIVKAGYHPSFRWFADIYNSDEYFINQDEFSKHSLIQKSVIWKIKVFRNSLIFLIKNRYFPGGVPEVDETTFLRSLKNNISL
jgi:GT2 family glycosyltransferase